MVEDYEGQLAELLGESAAARGFAIRRDDSTFAPPRGLDDFRDAVAALRPASGDEKREGLAARAADLAGRLRDQLLDPLRAARRQVNAAAASIRAPPDPRTRRRRPPDDVGPPAAAATAERALPDGAGADDRPADLRAVAAGPPAAHGVGFGARQAGGERRRLAHAATRRAGFPRRPGRSIPRRAGPHRRRAGDRDPRRRRLETRPRPRRRRRHRGARRFAPLAGGALERHAARHGHPAQNAEVLPRRGEADEVIPRPPHTW